MFLIQATSPADTVGYMIAGYTVIFGFMLAYLCSLYVRSRTLKRDLDALQELDEKKP